MGDNLIPNPSERDPRLMRLAEIVRTPRATGLMVFAELAACSGRGTPGPKPGADATKLLRGSEGGAGNSTDSGGIRVNLGAAD